MIATTTSSTTSARRRFWTRVLAGLLCAAAGTEATGCGGRRPQGAPEHLYVGIDTSGSATKQRNAFLLVAHSLANGLRPDGDVLSVYRVGHETRQFVEGPFGGDEEALARTLRAETEPIREPKGTLPAAFWTAVAGSARNDGGKAVDVIFLTDGSNDDLRASSWQAITADARRLAALPNVRSVVVCGATPDNWARLTAAFAPLGGRFRLLSPTECTPDAAARALEAV